MNPMAGLLLGFLAFDLVSICFGCTDILRTSSIYCLYSDCAWKAKRRTTTANDHTPFSMNVLIPAKLFMYFVWRFSRLAFW